MNLDKGHLLIPQFCLGVGFVGNIGYPQFIDLKGLEYKKVQILRIDKPLICKETKEIIENMKGDKQ